MNAMDIFTHISLNAAQSLFAKGLTKMTVVYDSNDLMSKEFLRSNFREHIRFVDVGLPDADYTVFQPVIKDCQSTIYLQNYFTIDAEMILEIAKQVPEYSAAFSLNSYTRKGQKQLKDLSTANLEELTQRQFA